MAGNIFETGMNALNTTYLAQRTMGEDRQRMRAGNALARGNRSQAAAEFGAAGLTDDVRQMQGDQMVVDDRKHVADQEALKQRTDALLKVAQALKTVPQGQRKPALDSLAPLWQKLNMDPSVFDKLDEAHLTDQSLDAFATSLGQKVEEYTLGADQVRYRGSEPIARGGARHDWKEVKNADGSTKWIDLADDGADVTSASPGAPTSTPTPAGSATAPRGLRNNNPLNVTGLGGGQKWDGQTGLDGKYATFATPEAGWTAADKNLQAYATKHGINTIAGVIQRWAPASENDTQSYIATVAKDLGVDPNQPLDLTNPQNRRTLLQAMAKVETGQAVSAPGAAPAKAGRRTVEGDAAPGPEWATLPPAEAAQYGPGQYQRNTKTGEVKQVTGTAAKAAKLTASALNIQNDHLSALNTASAINTRLASINRQLDNGDLDLGPAKNIFAAGQNAIGLSSAPSRAYGSFRADLEKMRNDSLRLNKGVQTEGDAQRAWNELMANLNDPKMVRQRLAEIQGYNDQAIAFHTDAVAQLREDAGLPPIDTSKFQAKPSPRGPAAVSATRAKPAGGSRTIRYDAQGNRVQ